MVALWLVVAFSCSQSNEYVKLCFVHNFWAPCQLFKITWKGDQREECHGCDWKITLQVFLVFPPSAFTHSPRNPGWQRRHSIVKLEVMPAWVLWSAHLRASAGHFLVPSPRQHLCGPVALRFPIVFVLSGALATLQLMVFLVCGFFFLPL